MAIVLARVADWMKHCRLLNGIFEKLGDVSFESYLTNINLNALLMFLIPAYVDFEFLEGRQLEYAVVAVLGLCLAFAAGAVAGKIRARSRYCRS